jgi:CheY-like chemotaxis protein
VAVLASPRRLRVLVADGDRAVLTIMRHGLEGAGVEVVAASDGASALRKLVDHLLGLDLLVTALELPVLDGRALVRIVRAEGGETELPILVLAATVSPRDRVLLARLCVTEIVEKHQGSEHVVERAVALATTGRERRVRTIGTAEVPLPALTPPPTPLGPVRLVKARGPA